MSEQFDYKSFKRIKLLVGDNLSGISYHLDFISVMVEQPDSFNMVHYFTPPLVD